MKIYRGKKTWTKTQGTGLKENIDSKGRFSDLEGYFFNLVPRALDKFISTMKELERYLGATYIYSFHPEITTDTPATLPDPDMPTAMIDTGYEHPKTDIETNYLKKKNIDEAIHQKMRKKYIYMKPRCKRYTISSWARLTKKLQEKAASYATSQVVKSGGYPIIYLMTLKKICL